jgi:hypothetical protein
LSSVTLIDSCAHPAVAPVKKSKATKNDRIEVWPFL